MNENELREKAAKIEDLPIFLDGGIGARLLNAMERYRQHYVYSPDDGPDHEPSDFENLLLEDFLNGAFVGEATDILQEAAKLAALSPSPVVEGDGWREIETCPYRTPVDLWCIYGGEEFAQYDGGASIGTLVSNRHKTQEYGFFGNQSNDGVPRGHAPDLKPVAWRPAVQQCPSALIAQVLGIPLTREDAIAASPPTPAEGERG